MSVHTGEIGLRLTSGGSNARLVALTPIDLGEPMEESMVSGTNVVSSILLGAAMAVAAGTASVVAKECYAPDARSQERAFSRAVVTQGGKTVWLGGQTGSPALDFEGQAREAFSELDKSIKAVGGNGLKDMVAMTVFINDVRLGDRLTEIRKEIFKECFPGSALITVSGFARPGILIEIQGTAVIEGK
jgi:2-iminobutanoate/2-iminopropanoate deaminase